MPPRARAQQTAWKTGNRRPKKPWPKRVQQSFRKQLRKRPLLGLILQIAFAVLAVILLVTGLMLESLLFYLATALSALGALATRRAVVLEQERQKRGPRVTPPSPRSGPRKAAPKPGGSDPPPPTNGVVKCTETGKPTKDCECASRHITTKAKSEQFGRPIGSPYGRRNKPSKVNTDKAGARS
jgi:hypothetical protein